MEDIRTIHTGLYTKATLCYIDGVLGQLSDGWGENNPRNDRYWRNAIAKQADNGEVIIEVNAYAAKYDRYRGKMLDNPFYNRTDEEVKAIFAKFIKKTVKMEITDWNRWNRYNVTSKLDYFYNGDDYIPCVADAYFVYEYLLGRNMTTKRETSMDLIGTPLSDDEVANNKQRSEELHIIKDAFAKATKDIEDKYIALRQQLEVEKSNEREQAYKAFLEAMKEHNAKFGVA